MAPGWGARQSAGVAKSSVSHCPVLLVHATGLEPADFQSQAIDHQSPSDPLVEVRTQIGAQISDSYRQMLARVVEAWPRLSAGLKLAIHPGTDRPCRIWRQERNVRVGGICKQCMAFSIWIDYFCRERLGLHETILAGILADLRDGLPKWEAIIRRSFLSPPPKPLPGDPARPPPPDFLTLQQP
ncbi:MAG: hypothetical protein RLZZ398_2043 [Verrucomicrobiota bacterium]